MACSDSSIATWRRLAPGVLATVVICAAAAGCMGSWAMRGTRLHYNKSLSYTASQEILLNIVRMRYGETPTFLDMPSIVSQSEARVDGTAGQVAGLQGVVGGNFTLRDSPTLSYQPRTGNDLGNSMVKALKAEVFLDVPPGNDTRTFMLMFIDSINGVRNSPSATSPSSRILEPNDDYRYVVDLYAALQNRGAVIVKVATRDEKPQGSPIPADRVLTYDMFTAADNGYLFQVAGDEAVLLKRSRFAALTIQPESGTAPEVEELRRMFRLKPDKLVYRIKSQEDDEIDLNEVAAAGGPSFVAEPLVMPQPGGTAEDVEVLPAPEPAVELALEGPTPATPVSVPGPTGTLTINVRSGYQAMAFLSKGVDVPDAHVRRGTVHTFQSPDHRPFDGRQLTRGLFRVCVQKHKPFHSDLAVHYRGYWFYIPQDDVQSRTTLNFLKFVTETRSEAGSAPVLTLPVN
jgi:hypothetical protein